MYYGRTPFVRHETKLNMKPIVNALLYAGVSLSVSVSDFRPTTRCTQVTSDQGLAWMQMRLFNCSVPQVAPGLARCIVRALNHGSGQLWPCNWAAADCTFIASMSSR